MSTLLIRNVHTRDFCAEFTVVPPSDLNFLKFIDGGLKLIHPPNISFEVLTVAKAQRFSRA